LARDGKEAIIGKDKKMAKGTRGKMNPRLRTEMHKRLGTMVTCAFCGEKVTQLHEPIHLYRYHNGYVKNQELLLEAVREQPGMVMHDYAMKLKVSPSAIARSMKNLSEKERMHVVRKGAAKHLFLGPAPVIEVEPVIEAAPLKAITKSPAKKKQSRSHRSTNKKSLSYWEMTGNRKITVIDDDLYEVILRKV